MKNKLSHLEQLRHDRAELEMLSKEQEIRLSESFAYAANNWGSLLLRSIFLPSSKSDRQKDNDSSGTSVFGNISDVVSRFFPIAWELAQPYLIGLAMKKIKGMFSKPKKNKPKN